MTDSVLDTLKSNLVVGPERHRFKLLSPLGQHPYGLLWKAEDLATSTATEVTLLFIPDVLNRQQSCIESLRKQVIIARKCKHPNALDCYGLFSHKGAVFLAFESVDGLTLEKMFTQNQAQKLKPEQKQGLTIQIGKALDAFHRETRKNHTSLSPELIFISQGKGVRVMMIGWREVVDEYIDLLEPQPTYRQYQAPEGFDPLPTTQKSDIYALATIIYHLHAGKPAFLPSDDEKSRFQRELKAPSSLEKHQWKSLQDALHPDQDSRPKTVVELLKQLYSTEVAEPEPSADSNSINTETAQLNETDTQANNSLETINKSLPSFLAKPLGYLVTWLERLSSLIKSGIIFVLGILLGLLIGLILFTTDVTPYTEQIQHLENELGDRQETLEALRLELDAPAIEAEEQLSIEEPEDTAPAENSHQPTSAQATTRESIATTDQSNERMRFQDFFGDDGFAPVMQELPLGDFLMGDLNRTGDDNERPVRAITFDYRFAIGVQEVTFDEYDQFARATDRPLPDDEGWGRGDRPVINVSWEDARDYARWLREVTGESYRLPTEAEWEYAARAGTGSSWWWGNEVELGMAVCDGCGTEWDGRQTAPVGQYSANEWGIHDMHGNVEEWVQDCYADDYTSAPEDGSAMLAGNCQQRVLRGGSWFDIPRVIRSSSRYRQPIDFTQNTIGFRVAMDISSHP